MAAIDYFSWWFEAVPLAKVKANTIVNFVKNHIICRFSVSKCLYHDNGPQFTNKKFCRFCEKYGIHCSPSTAYSPSANGLVEGFNKTMHKILNKTVSDNKKSWGTKLYKVFWANQTTVRGMTKSTPFSLVYGSEAVIPLEVQLPSLRVAIVEKNHR